MVERFRRRGTGPGKADGPNAQGDAPVNGGPDVDAGPYGSAEPYANGSPGVGAGPERFVAVGVSRYRHPAWPDLPHVPASVQRVRALLTRLGYVQELTELADGGDWRAVSSHLAAWPAGGERVVLYWTGHGLVEAGRHFLATEDSPPRGLHPFNALQAADLARLLAHRPLREVLLLIDACASGAAASMIAAEIGEVVSHAGPDAPRFAVIASTHGYGAAEDGVFAEALERVVRFGPDDRRWTEHDALIRSDELSDVLHRALADRDGATDYRAVGAPVPALRNPLHPRAAIPDEDVETKRLRRLRAADVDQHLVLSARGIEVGETGWYFCGRGRLMQELSQWICGDGRGLFAVTGSPGTGKSAVLGRIATLSVPALRGVAQREGALDGIPAAQLPREGSVDIALSCRNKTLDDCLRAVAAGLGLPLGPSGRPRAVEVVAQVAELDRHVAVVVDALDEAQPAEAIAIAADLLRPLADLPGVRVLVGTRPGLVGSRQARRDRPGPLLLALAPDRQAVLDDEPDTERDLTAYALKRLQDAPDSPLRDRPELARAWARWIVAAGQGVFLYARVAARAVLRFPGLRYGPVAASPLSGHLADILDQELARFPDPVRIRELLAPVAWAQGAGLPRRELWPLLATALSAEGRRYADADVAWALEHAGFYLVEAGESDQTVYRLYHQALIDYFRAASPPDAQRRITRVLLDSLSAAEKGPGTAAQDDPPGRTRWAAWAHANPYVHRHAATHAREAGLLPDLLGELGFLAHTDPSRTATALLSSPERFASPRARLYLRAARQLRGRTPAERLERLHSTAAAEEPRALSVFAQRTGPVARVTAASTGPDDFGIVLRGHAGPVTALTAARLPDGREQLVSAGGDTSVRIWDADSAETLLVLTTAQETVTALAALPTPRGTLLAAGAGTALHIWQLPDGEPLAVGRAHTGRVLALAATDDGGPPLLVSAGEDRRVLRWDAANRRPDGEFTGHLGPVGALALAAPSGRGNRLLLSGGADCDVRLWDADRCELLARLHGHLAPVSALLHLGHAEGRALAASGDTGGTVRIWDLTTRRVLRVLPGVTTSVRALAALPGPDGSPLLAVAGTDSRIILLSVPHGDEYGVLDGRPDPGGEHPPVDASTGRGGLVVVPEPGPPAPMRLGSLALASVASPGGALLASAGADGAVRLWHRDSHGPPGRPHPDAGRCLRIASVRSRDGAWRLATGGTDGAVRCVDPLGKTHPAAPLRPAEPTNRFRLFSTLTLPDGTPLVAWAGNGGDKVFLADAETGESAVPEGRGFLDDVGFANHLDTWSASNGTAAALLISSGQGTTVWLWKRHEASKHTVQEPPDVTGRPRITPWESGTAVAWTAPDAVHFRAVEGTAPGKVSLSAPLPDLPGLPVRGPHGRTELAVACAPGRPGAGLVISLVGLPGGTRRAVDTGYHGMVTAWCRFPLPSGDRIAAACDDATLRVWDPRPGGNPPLVIPLTDQPTEVAAAPPDALCALVGEHWQMLRLTTPL